MHTKSACIMINEAIIDEAKAVKEYNDLVNQLRKEGYNDFRELAKISGIGRDEIGHRKILKSIKSKMISCK